MVGYILYLIIKLHFIPPPLFVIETSLDTWAKSGHKDGAAKAMTLLKRMEKLYYEEGELGMKPNGM